MWLHSASAALASPELSRLVWGPFVIHTCEYPRCTHGETESRRQGLPGPRTEPGASRALSGGPSAGSCFCPAQVWTYPEPVTALAGFLWHHLSPLATVLLLFVENAEG